MKNTIIVILSVLVIGLGSYIVFDKVINNKTQEQKNSAEQNEKNSSNQSNQSAEITLTSEQAFKLIETKRKSLNYDTWSTLKAKVLKKGDNNYFYVTYTEANVDGGNSPLSVIFHYENGNWNFDLPGFSGTTEQLYKKYNFVDIK